ncbi:MAG TPA: hypothetical protein VK002_16060 [Rubricoccaceae bacterium]|nr:hypothetical protein [Rubricoccaceae bacterium]
MLDAPAGALARHLLTLLPPDRPHERADLARLPIPVAHYLGGVLDRRLAREAALPASDWFDGEADAVQEAARAWHAATRDTARFPADAWADTVHDAARAVLGYLVEPAEALTERVFADEAGPLPIEAVRARMATFSPYPYLREIAEGYFARKGVEAVGRDDFERLLRRIDRRMVSPFGPHDWLSLLEPLFELLRPLPDDGRVPAPLLRRFFEAKGYDDLARTLDADAYDADALRAALADALPDIDLEEPARGEAEAALLAVAPDAAEPPAVPVPEGEAETEEPEPEPEPEEAEVELEPESEPVAEALPEPAAAEPLEPEEIEEAPEVLEPTPTPHAPPPAADEPEADEPEEIEPLWLRLARRREAERPSHEHTAPEPDPAPPAARSPQPEAEAEPLWKRFAAGAADAPAADAPARPAEPLARLETRVLGPSATERRAWYVANLTGGSEAAYRAVLEQLDAAPSWTAASQIIAREVFRKHHVNIYSDAAVAFTDAAEARFTRQ